MSVYLKNLAKKSRGTGKEHEHTSKMYHDTYSYMNTLSNRNVIPPRRIANPISEKLIRAAFFHPVSRISAAIVAIQGI